MQRRGDLASRSKSGQQIKTAPDCDLLPTPEKRDIDPNLDVGRSFLGFFFEEKLGKQSALGLSVAVSVQSYRNIGV